MIAIIDYGAGNLFSVKNALNFIGAESVITKDVKEIENADKLILPGVGAFPDAMKMLEQTELVPIILEQVKRKPLLGICLGMQLLFEKGFEYGICKGLGLIKGTVELIPDTGLLIPQIGWNALDFNVSSPLLDGITKGSYVYFVHSYMARCSSSNVACYCDYGVKVPALVQNENVFGAQFHPEKSGEVGLKILKNFVNL